MTDIPQFAQVFTNIGEPRVQLINFAGTKGLQVLGPVLLPFRLQKPEAKQQFLSGFTLGGIIRTIFREEENGTFINAATLSICLCEGQNCGVGTGR